MKVETPKETEWDVIVSISSFIYYDEEMQLDCILYKFSLIHECKLIILSEELRNKSHAYKCINIADFNILFY